MSRKLEAAFTNFHSHDLLTAKLSEMSDFRLSEDNFEQVNEKAASLKKVSLKDNQLKNFILSFKGSFLTRKQ